MPGVESVGLIDTLPAKHWRRRLNRLHRQYLRSAAIERRSRRCHYFNISPEYFHAAGTALMAGRAFTWQDDKNSPRVAVVNGEFARKLFGSAGNAMGHSYKMRDGTRIQVVGIAEDGKYNSLTEDPVPAMFLPILQSPTTSTVLVVRSRPGENHAPQLAGRAMRNALRQLDAGMPLDIETRDKPMEVLLFGPRMAAVSLGVLGIMGAILSITGLFGMAAYSVSKRLKELGIRVALGAKQREVLRAALGRAFKLLAIGSVAGLLSEFWPPGCWPSSCTRPRPATRWYWPALFSRCCCWASWPPGFPRNARCRLILGDCCGRNNPRRDEKPQ